MVTEAEMLERISLGMGDLESVVAESSGPARLYSLPEAPGRIGGIAAMSNHFCATCNRIRVTADGRLRPCLLSDNEFDLKKALLSGADFSGIAEIVRQAVAGKSPEHDMACNAERKCTRMMSTIGG